MSTLSTFASFETAGLELLSYHHAICLMPVRTTHGSRGWSCIAECAGGVWVHGNLFGQVQVGVLPCNLLHKAAKGSCKHHPATTIILMALDGLHLNLALPAHPGGFCELSLL